MNPNRMPLRRMALLPVLVIAGAAAPPPPGAKAPSTIDPLARSLEAEVRFLADDLFEGRGLGTRGHELAAKHVAAEFTRMGLQPAGTDGWFQRISFAESRFTSAGETMTFGNGTASAVWRNGSDMVLASGDRDGAETITAPLVFIGYGIRDKRLGIDDLAGIDLKGKIAVALVGAPPGMNSEIGAHLGRMKGASVLAAGGIGLIQVRSPADAARQPWAKLAARGRLPRRVLLGPDGAPLGDGAGLAVRATISESAAAQLFAGAPQSFEAVQAEAAQGPVTGFVLPGTVTIARAQAATRVTSPNIIGILPGSKPALAGDLVMLSAHLDHVGMAAEGEGDRIFNGAMDNASGVAVLMDTARALVRARPRRSILFVVTTAEESGLLGAEYFARFPTVAMPRVVSVVNLDMPILTCDFADIVPFGADRSTMMTAVAAAAKTEKLAVSPDPQPAEAIFTRSDHYALVRAGVPAVFLKTGWRDQRGGTACKVAERTFRVENYHERSDDMAMPWDWAAAARFTRLTTGIMRRIADAPQPPRWYAGDYFGESFAPAAVKAKR
jgi:Zn-dependent M28 family amino/carboxypeptidase